MFTVIVDGDPQEASLVEIVEVTLCGMTVLSAEGERLSRELMQDALVAYNEDYEEYAREFGVSELEVAYQQSKAEKAVDDYNSSSSDVKAAYQEAQSWGDRVERIRADLKARGETRNREHIENQFAGKRAFQQPVICGVPIPQDIDIRDLFIGVAKIVANHEFAPYLSEQTIVRLAVTMVKGE